MAFKHSTFDFSDVPNAPTGFNDLGLLKPAPQEALQAFAKRNQLTYSPKTTYDPARYDDLEHFNTFDSIRKSLTVALWSFQCHYNNTPFTAASIRWPRNRTYMYSTFISVPLAQKMPDVFICSLLPHNAVDAFTTPYRYSADQRIHTGDQLFDTYFAVYTPPASRRIVTESLLTSEFMNTLLQYAPMYDIGIHDGNIHIFTGNRYTTREDFAQLFLAGEALMDVLADLQLPEYVVDNNAPTKLTHNHSLLRLIMRSGLIAISIGLALGLGIIYSLTPDVLSAQAIIIVLLIIGGFIGTFVALGPDKQQPKRAKDARELAAHFGQINIGRDSRLIR